MNFLVLIEIAGFPRACHILLLSLCLLRPKIRRWNYVRACSKSVLCGKN